MDQQAFHAEELKLQQARWVCVYCGKAVPDGCPHPAMFACCGEVGHVEPTKENDER